MSDEHSDLTPLPPPAPKPTTKQLLIGTYLGIAVLFTFYNWLWGAEHYRGFFYNFGKSLAWPFQIFSVLGEIVGTIFMVVLIGAVLLFGSSENKP